MLSRDLPLLQGFQDHNLPQFVNIRFRITSGDLPLLLLESRRDSQTLQMENDWHQA